MPAWNRRPRMLLVVMGLVLQTIGNSALGAEVGAEVGEEPSAAPGRSAKNGANDSSLAQQSEHNKDSTSQAVLDARFAEALSGAVLEGSYTISGRDTGPATLRKEKYTLSVVKRVPELGENMWLFPARIEYDGKDLTLPIPLPVEWADETPVIVVDNVTLPGFGTVSARVLFHDGHYAGYWKHGEHSGNLFGTYHKPAKKPSSASPKKKDVDSTPPANGQPSNAPGRQSGGKATDAEKPNE